MIRTGHHNTETMSWSTWATGQRETVINRNHLQIVLYLVIIWSEYLCPMERYVLFCRKKKKLRENDWIMLTCFRTQFSNGKSKHFWQGFSVKWHVVLSRVLCWGYQTKWRCKRCWKLPAISVSSIQTITSWGSSCTARIPTKYLRNLLTWNTRWVHATRRGNVVFEAMLWKPYRTAESRAYLFSYLPKECLFGRLFLGDSGSRNVSSNYLWILCCLSSTCLFSAVYRNWFPPAARTCKAAFHVWTEIPRLPVLCLPKLVNWQ